MFQNGELVMFWKKAPSLFVCQMVDVEYVNRFFVRALSSESMHNPNLIVCRSESVWNSLCLSESLVHVYVSVGQSECVYLCVC